jgi:hypothetical protein
MTYFKILLSLALILFAAPVNAMTFKTGHSGGNCSTCVWIAAEGEITENTPDEFLAFLDENPEGYAVYLNSEGGNLIAGLRLGAIIREQELSTVVSATTQYEDSDWVNETAEGICYSACAYAFLGGINRTVKEKEIGFHQFYSDGKSKVQEKPVNDFSSDQLLSGLLSKYISDMGIKSELLILASTEDKTSLYFPTNDDIEKLNISTGYGYSDWSLEPYNNGLVATSQNKNKTSAVRKVSTFCSSRSNQVFLSLVSNTQTRHVNLEYMKGAISGATINFDKDSKEFEIPKENVSIVDIDGYVTVMVAIPRDIKAHFSSNSNLALGIDAPMSAFRPSLWYHTGSLQNDLKSWNVTWKNCV